MSQNAIAQIYVVAFILIGILITGICLKDIKGALLMILALVALTAVFIGGLAITLKIFAE